MMKTKWYPRPHSTVSMWAHGLESGIANQYTNVPIAMYDEGLGTPSDYEANPEHASFVQAAEPNVYPQSKLDTTIVELEFAMTKLAIETDACYNIRCMFMPTFFSFLEDYTAKDELTGLTVATILEMQTETTDRQGYPLFNAIDMKTHGVITTNQPTNVPGLT